MQFSRVLLTIWLYLFQQEKGYKRIQLCSQLWEHTYLDDYWIKPSSSVYRWIVQHQNYFQRYPSRYVFVEENQYRDSFILVPLVWTFQLRWKYAYCYQDSKENVDSNGLPTTAVVFACLLGQAPSSLLRSYCSVQSTIFCSKMSPRRTIQKIRHWIEISDIASVAVITVLIAV